MRIRTLLALATAAILLPVLIAAVIAFEKVKDGEREAALRGLRETVRASTLLVDREIRGSLGKLEAIGNSSNLAAGNLDIFYSQATALSSSPDVWTVLFDAQGRQILNTYFPFETARRRNSPSERLATVLEEQQPYVSDIFSGRSSGKLLTAVYIPAKAGGGRKYIVGQAFSLDYWKKTSMAVKGQPDWIVSIIDRTGRFIARSQGPESLIGQQARPALVDAADASPDGLIRHKSIDGIDAYTYYAHSSLTGWTVAVTAPITSIEAAARNAVIWLMAGMAIATCLALIGAYAFGLQIVNAVASASSAARSLGRGERPPMLRTSLKEVNALNRELHHAGELIESERRRRQAAEAQREQLLTTETRAKESAELANRAKDEFLAMLGHELRNPLAAIAGAIGLLERFASEPQRSARYLEIVRRQSRNLSSIVDDLLDVGRLLSGKIALATHAVDLLQCITHCVEAIRTTQAAEGYHIVTALPQRPLWVLADPARLDQIIGNLLVNALKYSRRGMEVHVDARAQGANVVVDIRDHGVGITADLLPHIFEPFVQGPPLANRTQSGLGIGLVLVQHLVTLHEGTVTASSEGTGRGSTFTVTLPGAMPPAVAQVPQLALATAPVPRRVFLVEDNEDVRTTLVDGLSSLGCHVASADDGRHAVDLAVEHCPDVIVLDIGLPGMDGHEVVAQLKADARTRHIPVIALTGYGRGSDREQALAAGFDVHLAKPVDVEDLKAAIDAIFDPRAWSVSVA